MFYLYDMSTHSKLDVSDKEIDIINTMSDYYKASPYCRFIIVEYDEITTEPRWRSVRNIGDYEAYIQEYNQKNTCVQLKREILDLSGTKVPQIERFTKK